jgi:hypothetical protein
MRVSQRFGNYNQRRYGRPWIARITGWPVGGKPEIVWGSYVGDDGGGEVEIEAISGDIVRTGQKDYRGNNTDASWYIVQPDGSLSSCTAAEARQAWDAQQAAAATANPPTDLAGISDIDLINEIKRRGLSCN